MTHYKNVSYTSCLAMPSLNGGGNSCQLSHQAGSRNFCKQLYNKSCYRKSILCKSTSVFLSFNDRENMIAALL